MPRFPIWILLAALLLLINGGCTGSDSSTHPAIETPASLESQLANGAPIYAQNCATSTCHGTQGEGLRAGTGFSAWPLVGPEFQTRHPNAEVVFDVVRSGSEPSLRALTDQQIYDAIAYQLYQNGITLTPPLTASNAFNTYGGTMSGVAGAGLSPPCEDVALTDLPFTPTLPVVAENERLRLQVDQIAAASSIGASRPPGGGAFLILVLVFNALEQEPLLLSPDDVQLSTPDGALLQPQFVDLHAAIESFHTQTIKPYHGTSVLIVFPLFSIGGFDQLIYEDQAGNRLILDLIP